MKRWTPGRKAIAQMWEHVARRMVAHESPRSHRLGLQIKTQALIYMDRMATNG